MKTFNKTNRNIEQYDRDLVKCRYRYVVLEKNVDSSCGIIRDCLLAPFVIIL